MRKAFYLLSILFVSIFALSLTSCHKKELKQMRGLVTKVDIHGDTLLDVTVRQDDDSLTFQLDNARFNNGVMMPNDSVIIDYVDDGSDLIQAAVVTILPQKPNIIDPAKMANQKLITAPDTGKKK